MKNEATGLKRIVSAFGFSMHLKKPNQPKSYFPTISFTDIKTDNIFTKNGLFW
jgi:hypothetical protein